LCPFVVKNKPINPAYRQEGTKENKGLHKVAQR
jgi:hypothetical protein